MTDPEALAAVLGFYLLPLPGGDPAYAAGRPVIAYDATASRPAQLAAISERVTLLLAAERVACVASAAMLCRPRPRRSTLPPPPPPHVH